MPESSVPLPPPVTLPAGSSAPPRHAAPLRLLVLNPNSTEAMTLNVAAEVLRIAGPRIAPQALTAVQGPPVIASRESFAAGAAAGWQALATHGTDGIDAVLLACFGDPGLHALRSASAVPVVGMADAALRAAVRLQRPFHIVTAGAAWDAMLRETVQAHPGAEALLDGITILDTTGLAIARDPLAFEARVQAALDALPVRGTPTCILGGAGFAGMAPRLRYGGVLTDGIRCAVEEMLAP
jgi:allantoin racemase